MGKAAWWFLMGLAAGAANGWAEEARTSTTTALTAPAADGFSAEAAKRLGVPADKIVGLRRRGFGKTEALVFTLVAKASSKTWEALFKEREAGVPLRRLAEEAGLAYDPLFERCLAIRGEIDAAVLSAAPETGTVAP